MSGTIRINIRTLERTVWIIVTLALVGLLVWQWDSAGTTQPDVDVATLQEELATLKTENADLENQLTEAQADLQVAQEAEQERTEATGSPSEVESTPEPEPEPEEPTLSGIIDVSWTVRMDSSDSDKLDRVSFSIENGLETTERITYALYWESFFDDKVRVTDQVTLRSGEGEAIQIIAADEGFATNPPAEVKTLVLELTDDDDNLIDQLEKDVR